MKGKVIPLKSEDKNTLGLFSSQIPSSKDREIPGRCPDLFFGSKVIQKQVVSRNHILHKGY